MSDGLWNAGANVITGNSQSNESIRRGEFVRHRLLQVSLSTIGTLFTGDASSHASQDPNGLINLNQEGGPHFVFSPETTVGSRTYGFEWCLFVDGMEVKANAGVGGFTVTIWELIGNAQTGSIISVGPLWASFQPRTAVQTKELYHSFDVNATAIRFQISNAVDNESSIGIALVEL